MTDHKRRFTFASDLTRDTPFMGATAGEWHDALTGHGQFQKQLEVVKARVLEVELAKTKADAPAALAALWRKWSGNDGPTSSPITQEEIAAAARALSINIDRELQ